MPRLTYDISMFTGLASVTGGTAMLAGPAWAAIAFGALLIGLTYAGAKLATKD